MADFQRRIDTRLRKALRDYRLIEDGDKILIALSGGKDSLALVELLGRRMKIFKPRFTAEAIHVRMENIDYESSTEYLEKFCADCGIKLHVVTTSFDASTDKRSSPCFLCPWNRRKEMFRLAQEQGFNKIALGHHQDDIIQTMMMNLLFHGHFEGMSPKLKLDKMPITIIRPLCLEHEDDLRAMAKEHGYKSQKKICPYDNDTKRAEMAELYKKMEAVSPHARNHIWNALQKSELS
jgi:tRNA(Ile)-lysidine synthase TilS/MesJ